jgi:oxalate decarboxylase/phosphoglucose isomerase-like protein (cupin superfamily)
MINSTKLSIRKPEEIQEVMMDPSASIPEEIYYMIRTPGRNITVLPKYRLGKEYPKTYGHFHKPEAEETYEVLLGEAAMLLQKGINPVKEIKLVRMGRNKPFTVPKGYAHAMINLGKGPVVTVDDNDPERMTNDYLPIKEKHGFAYYLVEDDEGRPKAIPNSNYSEVPSLKIDE